MKVLNVAFYQFMALEGLDGLRRELRDQCRRLGLKGTVILSSEGINAFLAGEERPLNDFIASLPSRLPGLQGTDIKRSWSETIPFQRMFVKLKKEIIPFGIPEINPLRKTGSRLAPEELKRWLDQGKDVTLLDTRNLYEIRKGTFKNAAHLNLNRFRQLPERLREISGSLKDKPVVMFCTGGIRCEKATAFAMDLGFKEVYQLEGGILKYFERCGKSHYEGDCFVFDERVAVNQDLAPET